MTCLLCYPEVKRLMSTLTLLETEGCLLSLCSECSWSTLNELPRIRWFYKCLNEPDKWPNWSVHLPSNPTCDVMSLSICSNDALFMFAAQTKPFLLRTIYLAHVACCWSDVTVYALLPNLCGDMTKITHSDVILLSAHSVFQAWGLQTIINFMTGDREGGLFSWS